MFKTFITFSFLVTSFVSIAAPKGKMAYFSCVVNEPVTKTKTAKVTVKFAVKNFSIGLAKDTGELIQYPGLKEEDGAISVSPQELVKGKKYALMTNLNGQGGDLRIEGANIRLFGDGDGYQFTDLVIWDADSGEEKLEGYVHDYGPTYGKFETFKQFIKCTRSSQVL